MGALTCYRCGVGKRLQSFASTPLAMEDMLADERRNLGAQKVAPTRAGVACTGNLRTAYRVCVWSRWASRVLLRVKSFSACNDADLYEGVRSIRWRDHLSANGTLAVDFHSSSSDFTHSQYGAQRIKDAVVDQFREEFGVRPSVDLRRPNVRINALVRGGEVVLSIDLAGDGLFRRGYRTQGVQVEAPLKENLAAAILIRAGWPEVAQEGGCWLIPCVALAPCWWRERSWPVVSHRAWVESITGSKVGLVTRSGSGRSCGRRPCVRRIVPWVVCPP